MNPGMVRAHARAGWIGLMGALVASIALAGCASTASPTDVATSSPKPTTAAEEPTAEPSENPADALPESFDFGVSAEMIAPYINEDQGPFLSRHIEDRVLVALYYAQDLPKFSSDWYSVSKDEIDLIPPEISINNTPEQIMAIIGNMQRMSLTIPSQENDADLDAAAANRLIGGMFYQGDGTPGYNTHIQNIETVASRDSRVPNARTLAVSDVYLMPKVIDSTELATDSSGKQYRTLTLEEPGTERIYTIDVHWIVASNGVGMWVQG